LISFVILGEPASKANSRELATIGPKDARRTILRKSDKALTFEDDARRQIPPAARQRLVGPVSVTLRIFYASERPDLDESIVLDVLQDRWVRAQVQPERHSIDAQGRHTMTSAVTQRVLVQAGVYRNDRQVREKHVFHAIDRVNPRTEVVIEALQPQQSSFLEDDGVRQVARPSKSRPNIEKATA